MRAFPSTADRRVTVAGDSLEVSLGGLRATGESERPIRINPLPTAGTVNSHTEFSQGGFVLAFNAI